jgi:hypothetical protein
MTWSKQTGIKAKQEVRYEWERMRRKSVGEERWFHVAVTVTLLTLAKPMTVVSGKGKKGRRERVPARVA